ncbi:hypothetical protein ACQPZX_37475 [Actinoplanes sp. CA-142083]|uniref:hypothetical protein n=1 Tax=Actinoplanes sp. CA-142083 TaxID=3239903 RepID=UPI003D9057CB
MAAVANVLRGHCVASFLGRSDWDVRRLLRFFAGLALLALALTGPVAAPEISAPSPAVITTVTTPTSVTVSDSASAPSPVRVIAPPSLPEPAAAIVVAALTVVLAGAVLRVRGQRAPPTA